MKLLILIYIMFFWLAPHVAETREYVPVDKLQKNMLIPRIQKRMQRIRQYNPRLYGRIQNNARLYGGRLWHYNPRLYGRLPGNAQISRRIPYPRDPAIGRWVSIPPEYTPIELGGPTQPVVTVAVAGNPKGLATYKTASGKIKLFGTVELGRPLATVPDWLDVIKRNKNSPVFQESRYFNKNKSWGALQKEATGLNQMEQMRLVNRFWNTWPYKEDIQNWGQQDYWAIPDEFIKKSGDCEDYAIAKYYTLKELGFDPHKMRLVVLRDTIRNLAHAVLAVYIDDEAYILDNLSNTVLSHKRLTNYVPQYSVNEFGRWAHIKTRQKK